MASVPSVLHSEAVDDNLNNYKITETAKALQSFVDEMSNWYVPVSYTHLTLPTT